MNRTEQLKVLNCEIRRLFSEGIDEKAAFKYLSSDKRFDRVRRTSIQSIYSQMQKKAEKETRVRHLVQKHKQIRTIQKQLELYHHKAENVLLYDEPTKNPERVLNYWQSRFIVTERNLMGSNVDFHIIGLHDLFHNEMKQVMFPKVGRIADLHILTAPFILVTEINTFGDASLRLARLDKRSNNLQLCNTIEFAGFFKVLLDSSNPSKFVLRSCPGEAKEFQIYFYTLTNGTLHLDKQIKMSWRFYYVFDSYFNGQLLSLRPTLDFNKQMHGSKLWTYNFEQQGGAETTSDLSLLPDNVCASDQFTNYYVHSWARNILFLPIQFCLTKEHGVAFVEQESCNWTILEFANSLSIHRLQFVDNCNLMVYSKERQNESNFSAGFKQKVHKISMSKPEPLRNKAWIKLVMKFKREKAKDAFEEARKYLPFNSDVQSFVDE